MKFTILVLKLNQTFTADAAVEYDTSSRFNAVRLFNTSSQRFMIFNKQEGPLNRM